MLWGETKPPAEGGVPADVPADIDVDEETAFNPKDFGLYFQQGVGKLEEKLGLAETGPRDEFEARRQAVAEREPLATDGSKPALSRVLSKQGSFTLTRQPTPSPTPEPIEGWLQKENPTLGHFQWRWFVLRERKLVWYHSPDEASAGRGARGVLDFELMRAAIDAGFDDRCEDGSARRSSTAATAAGSVGAGGEGRFLCIKYDIGEDHRLCGAFSAVSGGVEFSVCPEAIERKFTLRAANRETAAAWVSALRAHVASVTLVRADAALLRAQKKFWRFDRISPSYLEECA